MSCRQSGGKFCGLYISLLLPHLIATLTTVDTCIHALCICLYETSSVPMAHHKSPAKIEHPNALQTGPYLGGHYTANGIPPLL